MKTVYNKSNGTPTIAHEDPKVAGRYALPAGSVDVKPPAFDSETQTCSWNGSEWVVADIPVPEPEPTPDSVPAMDQLRNQRNALLNETDWEVTRGIEEEIDITELKAYRSALRNLPQEIEAGNIEAPTLNENGKLVFNSWPVRG